MHAIRITAKTVQLSKCLAKHRLVVEGAPAAAARDERLTFERHRASSSRLPPCHIVLSPYDLAAKKSAELVCSVDVDVEDE